MVRTSLRIISCLLAGAMAFGSLQARAEDGLRLTITGIKQCGKVSRCAVVVVRNDTDLAQEVPISGGEVPEPHFSYEVRKPGESEWQAFAFSIGTYIDRLKSKTVPAHGQRTVLVWMPDSMPSPERYESYRLAIRLRSRLTAYSEPFGAEGPVLPTGK